jgi:hypothetical protein
MVSSCSRRLTFHKAKSCSLHSWLLVTCSTSVLTLPSPLIGDTWGKPPRCRPECRTYRWRQCCCYSRCTRRICHECGKSGGEVGSDSWGICLERLAGRWISYTQGTAIRTPMNWNLIILRIRRSQHTRGDIFRTLIGIDIDKLKL